MSNNTSRRSGALGFIIALVLLAFVVFAGQSGIFGQVSEGLQEELSAIFAKGQGGFHLTIAKILAAIGVLALTYLVCWLLRLLLKLLLNQSAE